MSTYNGFTGYVDNIKHGLTIRARLVIDGRSLDVSVKWSLDTDYCIISPKIIENMHMQPVGKFRDPNDNDSDESAYAVKIVLPNDVWLPQQYARAGDKNMGYELIVGTNLIQSGSFSLTPCGDKFIFTFVTSDVAEKEQIMSYVTVPGVLEFDSRMFDC